jgi:hypothetical protein
MRILLTLAANSQSGTNKVVITGGFEKWNPGKENKMLMVRIFVAAVFALSSLACFGEKDAPPFSRGVYLNYQGAKLAVGYTTISYVNDVLGEPDTKKNLEYGYGGFLWENLLRYSYYDGRLLLVFSKDKNILVQIIFDPLDDDKYTTSFKIGDKSGKKEIIAAIGKSGYKNGYEFKMIRENTIWLYYYKRESPYMNVTCEFKFTDDQTLYELNYNVDAPW